MRLRAGDVLPDRLPKREVQRRRKDVHRVLDRLVSEAVTRATGELRGGRPVEADAGRHLRREEPPAGLRRARLSHRHRREELQRERQNLPQSQDIPLPRHTDHGLVARLLPAIPQPLPQHDGGKIQGEIRASLQRAQTRADLHRRKRVQTQQDGL